MKKSSCIQDCVNDQTKDGQYMIDTVVKTMSENNINMRKIYNFALGISRKLADKKNKEK